MFLKCLLLLFFLVSIDGEPARNCPYPRIENGRSRSIRPRSKLVKFICYPGYTLVGNKYVTCRGGEWDEPFPVCVKTGCGPFPIARNSIPMVSHHGAYITFFCYPRHKMIGPSTIYCDGHRWNGTSPDCVDTTAPQRLSCNFEDADLCGWVQDERHDFDWKRLNKKTPSSFLFTGPSYDHTYGENGTGYFMYIESTSKIENETARLISPLFDKSFASNGCFRFFYHMYGQDTGGLRVFQKPEKVDLQNLLQMTDGGQLKYLLFEKWGNLGDVWYTAVATLADVDDDFQIVIEGIRGASYTSDIAIDDVAILQGEECTIARKEATTPLPPAMLNSCANRCTDNIENPKTGCGCGPVCYLENQCCPDYFDVCLSDSSTTSSETSEVDLKPQTQKLVASTTKPSTSSTTAVTTPPPTQTTTPKPTTPKTTLPTTTKAPSTTTKVVTTRKLPTVVFKTSTPMVNKTGQIEKDRTTKSVTVVVKPTAKVSFKPSPATPKPPKKTIVEDKMKAQKERLIEEKTENKNSGSSGVKTGVLIVSSLVFLVAGVLLVMWSRGAQGRTVLARLRGRVSNDPDVQYLHSSVDDD